MGDSVLSGAETPPLPGGRLTIPEAYCDLVRGRHPAAFTTVMPDGQPQTTVVWCDYDGTHLLVNTMRGFRKEKNMRANPRVNLLGYALENPLRSLEVRGTVVEMSEQGALAHLDGLSLRYTGVSPYFGKCVPAELQARETPVLCYIQPTRVVTLDAGAVCDRRVCPAAKSASHLDLLLNPIHAVLVTMMPDGQPQASVVWCDYDGECACINTTRERQKGKNMLNNPHVALLVIDPDDAARWIEIRGCVEVTPEGAVEHLDRLTRAYTRHEHYYGGIFPRAQQARETRIICRIHPTKVTYDAIHK